MKISLCAVPIAIISQDLLSARPSDHGLLWFPKPLAALIMLKQDLNISEWVIGIYLLIIISISMEILFKQSEQLLNIGGWATVPENDPDRR